MHTHHEARDNGNVQKKNEIRIVISTSKTPINLQSQTRKIYFSVVRV